MFLNNFNGLIEPPEKENLTNKRTTSDAETTLRWNINTRASPREI